MTLSLFAQAVAAAGERTLRAERRVADPASQRLLEVPLLATEQ